MIPELEAIIVDLESAMKGPAPERLLPSIVMRLSREVQRLRDRQNDVDRDVHQHMWNAINKIADANGVVI